MCIYDIKYAVLYWLADWIGKIWNIMYTSGYDSSNNKINTSKINLRFFLTWISKSGNLQLKSKLNLSSWAYSKNILVHNW